MDSAATSVMHGFLVLPFLLIVEGALAIKSVKVKEGSVAQLHRAHMKHGHTVTLENNCEIGTLVIRNCATDEKRKGCSNFKTPRFSLHFDYETVFVTLQNVTPSDAGCYVFQVGDSKEERFNVIVEPLGKNSKIKQPKVPNTHVWIIVCVMVLLAFLIIFYFQRRVEMGVLKHRIIRLINRLRVTMPA